MGYPARVATGGAQRLLSSFLLLGAPAPLFAAADLALSKSAGVVTEFVVPLGGQLREIAKGADGSLWFTETNGNRIGRIVP